ncbi:hypothetical protein V9T40_003242 [Parthenolecanium corni]|uniref:Sof1-like protein domain-containing protein n=1 Tax=Parthenolecanium corni TaxID=536013 RepID=A0AAN9Y7U0_9HEMI
MKVKVLTRNPDIYLRETKKDIHKLPRNYDPSLHPFEAPREYTKALNSVKLERVFAKPFIGNLDGHRDGISCIAKQSHALSILASGDYCGELRVWDLPQRKCKWKIQAHDGFLRGLTFCNDNERFISVGQDKTIKIWSADEQYCKVPEEPLSVILSSTVITGISHHQKEPKFATCGDVCQIWEESRAEPLKVMEWGVDSLQHVAFNPIESHILASCASDRSIILYDTREAGPIRKIVTKMRTNQLSWNPMEAFIFSGANEDYNVYSYDTRNLSMPVNIHEDHVSAVTSIDYAPTGREFVTGSYDKSVRIFEVHKGHSREIYHTKRMQHVTNVCWTLDNKYIVSASDEMNIRLWKARASEKLGVLRPREKAALEYADTLKQRFAEFPQIKRIARHRQVPRHIYHEQQQLRASKQKISRKEANRRAHSKPGTVPFVPARKKVVINEAS